jgi:hypothetical protein
VPSNSAVGREPRGCGMGVMHPSVPGPGAMSALWWPVPAGRGQGIRAGSRRGLNAKTGGLWEVDEFFHLNDLALTSVSAGQGFDQSGWRDLNPRPLRWGHGRAIASVWSGADAEVDEPLVRRSGNWRAGVLRPGVPML